MENTEPKYRRVLIKVSGEALAGENSGRGYDFRFIHNVCEVIKRCVDAGVQIGIVVGGGNLWRGVKNGEGYIERTRADYMGMMATVMNSLALADVLGQCGVEARVQTALSIQAVAETYSRTGAVRHLEQGSVVIFGCGTGSPYFSTDTAAALRAAEIGAEILMLAKNVDGIYDADPNDRSRAVKAKKYERVSYSDILAQRLNAIDSTATALLMENHIPALVFDINKPENIYRALVGENVGTIVCE